MGRAVFNGFRKLLCSSKLYITAVILFSCIYTGFGEYDRVFPMDIFPEQLVKAIITGDIDRMEALGIYEVAPEDFALCEFVDSSKLEVQRIVREGLDMLRKEMA